MVLQDYDAQIWTEEEALAADCIIFLSMAEEALRKTTQSTTPPDCWGCHGIE
jgi:hypothetical protein